MSRSARKRSSPEVGHDAFLDIVANLVGILIILVVILGTQSQKVMKEVREQLTEEKLAEAEATDEKLAELAQHSMRAAAAQADSDRFERLVERLDRELQHKESQRAVLMDLLTQAQLAWKDKQQELDQEAIAAAEQQSKLKAAKADLIQLQGERERLENQKTPVVAVAHLPTPMAKTVFGDELHFRLKENRLSVVPIDQLLEEIERDFKLAAGGSREGRLDSAVGPVDGYVAHYLMDKSRGMVNRDGRLGMATRVQVIGMKFEPLKEPHGQPIEKILAGRSILDIELAGRDPAATTITVWVYPNSFAAYRKLKEHLYARGFATAARPLPMGRPIIGSPNGSRSSAQ